MLTDPTLRVVVTTIQPPTEAMLALAREVSRAGGRVLVIGDKKGPPAYDLDGCSFCSLQDQQKLAFELGRKLPTGHYCRKNLGYLVAMKSGASPIYETDDDNAPLPTWALRQERVRAVRAPQTHWLNAYRYFSAEQIWPRGFPLDELRKPQIVDSSAVEAIHDSVAPIQQGLANGSPDVGAVWRLVLDRPFEFAGRPSLHLSPGSWCPFNSQSTWWWPAAYPLMYLPSHCSFRMTDIWRSFIAQRCLWELGHGVVFHAAEVIQERNEHNLMRDFADEVVGYLRNKEMVNLLAAVDLEIGQGAQGRNLLACYQALVAAGFFPEAELALVRSWLADLTSLGIEAATAN